ncbi:MAG TPA: hypothetical protein VLK84_26050 [Longimicrobium sp.]|nr:hypothetical protein [Longimicrobium sp.]
MVFRAVESAQADFVRLQPRFQSPGGEAATLHSAWLDRIFDVAGDGARADSLTH